LVIAIAMPVAIYPGRFSISMLQGVERYGLFLNLLTIIPLAVAILIALNSITIVFNRLVRTAYLSSSIISAVLMIIIYIVLYNAVTIAGFTPSVIPLVSLVPLIIGNMLLVYGYKRFKV
jgi:hypothetical protein